MKCEKNNLFLLGINGKINKQIEELSDVILSKCRKISNP